MNGFFGNVDAFLRETFFLDKTEGIVLLAATLAALVFTIVAVALAIAVGVSFKRKRPLGRVCTGIAVDPAAVKREFAVGEPFGCDGLVVSACYNAAPERAPIPEFAVIGAEELEKLEQEGRAKGCYVVKPDLKEPGKDVVAVKYRGRTAYYTVSVAGGASAAAAPASLPSRVVRYNRSFTSKFIQSDDKDKERYAWLKNELLSYSGVRARMSWKRETFRIGRNTVALFGYRGTTLCIYLPLAPADYANTKYQVEDVSANATFADTPCMYRLRSDKRYRYAAELFAEVMARLGIERIEREPESYYLPYETTEALMGRGLIKCEIQGTADGTVVLTDAPVQAEAAPAEAVPEEAAPEEAVSEVPAEAAPEEAAPEEAAPEEAVSEVPAEAAPEVPEEDPEVEDLTAEELDDVRQYEEAESETDGIEVIGVMFRRRGRKVYWFDPDGKTWEKGEIALYRSPDNPPQEVIVVDHTWRLPEHLVLPLKPLSKATHHAAHKGE